jgi:L-ascorbate metabolism protein UlaG (beta-lactamase superfamily)
MSMKVTKYPQSCLLLEKAAKRIVIDPGNFFAAKYEVDELGEIAAVLYTHQHPDHYDAGLAKVFKDRGIALYGNQAVCSLIPGACRLANGAGFTVAGFEILPHDLPHCVLADGSDGPPNTGYIVEGNFFHPGDGIETTGVRVDHLAVAIAGPSISLREAVKFA